MTIEYRGEISSKNKNKFSNWIFGCDICQDVCPWNKFSVAHNEPQFVLSDLLVDMDKENWKRLDKSEFNKMFINSAIQRIGFKGLTRNIKFVSENPTFKA